MQTVQSEKRFLRGRRQDARRDGTWFGIAASCALAAVLALFAFYLSLVATSAPVEPRDMTKVRRAIDVLNEKGFEREVFLLRHTVTFRSRDNWLNALTEKENAFAATNFPFQIVTLYPDFYSKATDDTERAMILLHEAQHLQGKDEHGAYSYVWQHREQLGWTQISHGTTSSYITIQQLTRENVPELFTCPEKVWNDCTELLEASR
jgi:hypothetical protein